MKKDKWEGPDMQRALIRVGRKAGSDRRFRRLCLKDPNAAVKQATGKEVPEGLTIQLVEPPEGVDMLFSLPPLMDAEAKASMGDGSVCVKLVDCVADLDAGDISVEV